MRQNRSINLARLNFGHQQVRRFPMVLIENEFVPSRAGKRCWKLDAKVAQQAEQIAAPSGSNGRGTESVFQHQVPTDDPGKDLCQRSIAIGVSTTRNTDGGGKFRVTQSANPTS